MKLDVHTHILPHKLPRFAERFGGPRGFIHIDEVPGSCRRRMVKDDGTLFREVEDNCFASQARLDDLNRTDVTMQVLSTVPVLFSYWAKPVETNQIAQFLNDDLAETCAQQSDRYVGLGTLPLQDPELACRELERCVNELGLYGVQIGSHVERPGSAPEVWNLSDPALFPVFARAAALDAAVFIHPWDMMGESRMRKYWLPWLVGMPAEESLAICSLIFGGVFERLPNLRVCVAHGGGSFAATIGRIQHGFDCRPDLVAVDNARPPSEYLGRFYVDSLVHDARVLGQIVESFGVDRVCLGSDHPFPLGEAHPGALIESMSMSSSARHQLLWDNGASFLGARFQRRHQR
jgi:aminocarboxymuconate-semialdehyde decarboxylase